MSQLTIEPIREASMQIWKSWEFPVAVVSDVGVLNKMNHVYPIRDRGGGKQRAFIQNVSRLNVMTSYSGSGHFETRLNNRDNKFSLKNLRESKSLQEFKDRVTRSPTPFVRVDARVDSKAKNFDRDK